MEEVKVFYEDTTPTMPGYYMICMHHELFHLGPTIGSYNLIMARLLDMSYANFLRLCRDVFGATIVGKNTYYPVAYFPTKLAARSVVNLLNACANTVLFEHDHPDYAEHQEYVEQFDAHRKEVEEKLHDRKLG